MLWVGAASLNLYLQANYTGPAFEESAISEILSLFHSNFSQPTMLNFLTVDGELPYRKSLFPELLVLARSVLEALATPRKATWLEPMVLDPDGKSHLGSRAAPPAVCETVGRLCTASLWSGRAVVTHRRLMTGRDIPPTLWAEAQQVFGDSIKRLCAGSKDVPADARGPDQIAAMTWLEWGMAEHHFDQPTKGKESFNAAKEASKVSVELTSSLGKRTKFQTKELPQLVVLAKSTLPVEPSTPAEKTELAKASVKTQTPPPTLPPVNETKATPSEAKLDVNGSSDGSETTPLVGSEVTMYVNGELASLRKAEHTEDSILLETTSFADPTLKTQENLHPIDQAILLALCLDVQNSNPQDGLTSEEMVPYVQRVLQNANNWMLYSTGLLERSWLDFESPYSRDRAVLQMQALLDQHSTRLTITQSSSKVVEESAKAPERLLYMHAIVYPPQWELKKDLADRYAKLGVMMSACELYEELELWDDVVDCYRGLGRVNKAEQIVRARLAEEETPVMWVALGDLTSDKECYEKAWELSKGRYARAKRSLGRNCFVEKDYAQAAQHFKEALAIMPLIADCWFILGLTCMNIEDWDGGLTAFTRYEKIYHILIRPEIHAFFNQGSITLRIC